MARGWESKSVELQQSEASEGQSKPSIRLSPDEIIRQREREGLALSRSRMLQQLEAAKNPRHREMLQQALDDLDKRLAGLGN